MTRQYEFLRPVQGPHQWTSSVGNTARLRLEGEKLDRLLELIEEVRQFQKRVGSREHVQVNLGETQQLELGDMPRSLDPRYTGNAADGQRFHYPQPQNRIALADRSAETFRLRVWPGQVGWYDQYHDDNEGAVHELFVEVVQRQDLLLLKLARSSVEQQDQLFEKLAQKGAESGRRLGWAALQGLGGPCSPQKLQARLEPYQKSWNDYLPDLLRVAWLQEARHLQPAWQNLCQARPQIALEALNNLNIREKLGPEAVQTLLQHPDPTIREQAIRSSATPSSPSAGGRGL